MPKRSDWHPWEVKLLKNLPRPVDVIAAHGKLLDAGGSKSLGRVVSYLRVHSIPHTMTHTQEISEPKSPWVIRSIQKWRKAWGLGAGAYPAQFAGTEIAESYWDICNHERANHFDTFRERRNKE